MAGEVKKNPYNYIEHLEYQNRAKKIKQQEEYKKNVQNLKREENFHLFFNGANDARIRENRKKTNFELSKSPAERQVWGGGKQQPRRKWNHPETPLMLKEPKGLSEHVQEDYRKSKDEFEKFDSYITKSTFKVAGNSLIRPDSKKEYHSIAQRIESLHPSKKDHILRILEQLEGDNELLSQV